MKNIKCVFQREQFYPGFIGLFFNPFYFARKSLNKTVRKLSIYIAGDTLDVGCGQKPYEKLFSKSKSYIGLEFCSKDKVGFKKADVVYDGKIFPFTDNSFDSAVTFEVLEHVFNPDEFLKEVNRVLKINGVLLMSVSFMWDEHEEPHDYARYSSFGLISLLGKYGFEVVKQRKTASGISAVFQLINAYIYRVISVKNVYLDLLLTLMFISPFNILGEILSRFSPSNKSLYIDNVILAYKKRGI